METPNNTIISEITNEKRSRGRPKINSENADENAVKRLEYYRNLRQTGYYDKYKGKYAKENSTIQCPICLKPTKCLYSHQRSKFCMTIGAIQQHVTNT
jgi:hypothetical protein